mgnify:CR=1 FL=1
MADDSIILKTENLVKEFKGFVAVNDVSLQVKRGDIHALIGPNGAGKTTVFNLLTKFLPPTRGQIYFNGVDITHEKPAQTARRGIVRSFQISATFPHLSVLENVRIALQRKRGANFDFWRSDRVLGGLDARARELIDASVNVDADRRVGGVGLSSRGRLGRRGMFMGHGRFSLGVGTTKIQPAHHG